MHVDVFAAIVVTFLVAALLGGLPEKYPGKPAVYRIFLRLFFYLSVLFWLLFR